MIKSEKAKMIAGELFNVYDPELVSERAIARQQVETFNQLGETNPHKSQQIIKRLFGATGDKIEVHATFRCDYGYNLFVGEDFFANYDCVILDVAPIKIGKHCLLGPKVQIYSVNHPWPAFFPSFGRCLGLRIHACDKWVECSPKNDLKMKAKAK